MNTVFIVKYHDFSYDEVYENISAVFSNKDSAEAYIKAQGYKEEEYKPLLSRDYIKDLISESAEYKMVDEFGDETVMTIEEWIVHN